MSKADVERLVSDLKADANLQSEVKAKATGIPSLVKVATERGYQITAEDIRQYARSQGQHLTDEQLESTTGGRPGPHPIIVIVPTIVVIILPF
jgi:predicted ribosomally synthesized peptide with nif11-like leader